jgi:hypothetical protein
MSSFLRRSSAAVVERDLDTVLQSLLNQHGYSEIRSALDRVATRSAPVLPLLVWQMVCELVAGSPSDVDLACVLRLCCRAFYDALPLALRRVCIRGEQSRIVSLFGQSFVLDSRSVVPEAITHVSYLKTPFRHARALLQRVCTSKLVSLSVQVASDQQVVGDVPDFVHTVRAVAPLLTELRVLANHDIAASMLSAARTTLTRLSALDLQMRHSGAFGASLAAVEADLRLCTALRELRLSCNAIPAGGFVPSPAADALGTQLTQLSLCGLTIHATTLEQLALHNAALEQLTLTAFPVADEATVTALSNLTSLKSLSLTWAGSVRRADGESPRFGLWDAIVSLHQLTSIATHGLPTPQGLAMLTALEGLRSLVVLNVSDAAFEFSSMSALRSLRLSFVSHKAPLTQLHSLPLSLHTLSLNLVPPGLDSKLPSMAPFQRLTNLRSLSIQRQKLPLCQCTDEMFARGFATMTRLEALALRGFPSVSLLAISAAAQLPHLRWLRIHDVDPGILVALHTASSLRTLELSFAPPVLDVVGALTQLRLLHVNGASDDVVATIGSTLPRCVVVNHTADMPAKSPFWDEFAGFG